MCGIAGRINFSPDHRVDRAALEAMTTSLVHRGPDAAGYFVADGIGLGHRRLSIIDLTAGDQPLPNEDQTVWIVFNGEIYNFAELRAELEASGHRFRTRCDTEAIVHAYEQWGDDAVLRLRGMFAFALWDGRRRRLLLARDRLGIKPLHYALVPGGLVFGSEMKALLQDPEVPADWSADALDAYMALQYVPTPRTIYKAIWKLPPGHLLTAEGGGVTVRRYWDLAFTADGDPRREREYLEHLDALVAEAVRLRLVSDVPLGAFLSGGIDSSTVLAAMVRASSTRVQALSVGFEHQAFDERPHAYAVAAQLGADVHERVVRPDVAELLPRLAWHFDEPFGDSSAVPTYYVSAAARERVTVALSGDGGDELWAGYTRHRVEHWEHAARRRLGSAGARTAGRLAGLLPLAVRGARSMRHLALPPADACARKHAYGLFDDDARPGLYSGDFGVAVADADPFAGFRRAYAACESTDPLDRALYVDVNTYLVDDILTKVDRTSMAVSLETRVPLLDHVLAEFAARVPSGLKLRHGRGKYLLRRLLERRVPASILERPKQGFSVPVSDWLRTALAPMVDDLLLDGRLRERGIFDARAVARLWEEHRAGLQDHGHRIWSLAMLELWFRQFVDRGRTSGRPGRVAAA
jgi:asparagine synthase (glutamine-hydrolysing)